MWDSNGVRPGLVLEVVRSFGCLGHVAVISVCETLIVSSGLSGHTLESFFFSFFPTPTPPFPRISMLLMSLILFFLFVFFFR